jgi:PAS domain S-box-containing protein
MEKSTDYPEGGQLFAELIPHIVWIARADGAVEYFNRRTLDYTGLPPEQLLGWGWLKLIHPVDALLAQETSKKAAQAAGPFETEFRVRKGMGTTIGI